jgi:hypothetical protein
MLTTYTGGCHCRTVRFEGRHRSERLNGQVQLFDLHQEQKTGSAIIKPEASARSLLACGIETFTCAAPMGEIDLSQTACERRLPPHSSRMPRTEGSPRVGRLCLPYRQHFDGPTGS